MSATIKRICILVLLVPLTLKAKTIDSYYTFLKVPAKSFPKDLVYKRKIIDPLCFSELKKKETSQDLSECGLHRAQTDVAQVLMRN